MIFKLFIAVILAVTLTGCTTTKRSPTAVNQLQIRVAQIENRIDAQDQDIVELQSDVKELKGQEKNRAQGIEPPNVSHETVKTPSVKTVKSDREGILRVPVTPQEVQIALQNAGYYRGAIDGKLGLGSQMAIREFQADHDLVSDGIIGKKTWAELKNYLE